MESLGISDIYSNIDVFLCILVRFFAFMTIMPIFSGQKIPATIRIMMGVAVSSLVVASGTVGEINYEQTAIGYAALILTEFLTGFIIGFVVYFMFSVFHFVGQMVDYQLGFSMASVLDPGSGEQVSVTGNLFYLAVMVLFVIGGGLDYFIKIVFDSYSIIPPGQADLFANGELAHDIVVMITRYFEIGMIIALPVIGAVVIIDIALGLLTKAVPQMNVFVVGIPVKLFAGLIILGMLTPSLLEGFRLVYNYTVEYTDVVIRGLAQ